MCCFFFLLWCISLFNSHYLLSNMHFASCLSTRIWEYINSSISSVNLHSFAHRFHLTKLSNFHRLHHGKFEQDCLSLSFIISSMLLGLPICFLFTIGYAQARLSQLHIRTISNGFSTIFLSNDVLLSKHILIHRKIFLLLLLVFFSINV